MNIRVLDRARNSVAQQGEQSVIDSGKIDIDRFDVARTSRNGMKIPDDEVSENAPLEPKFEFQVFLCCVMERDAMT